MPAIPGIIDDGPLTIEPAKSVDYPNVYKIDTFGHLVSSSTDPLEDAGLLQAAGAVSTPVFVTIPNRPDKSSGDSFRVEGPTDMGKYFTQEQIQGWFELKKAIENGLVTATVAGTVPWQAGP